MWEENKIKAELCFSIITRFSLTNRTFAFICDRIVLTEEVKKCKVDHRKEKMRPKLSNCSLSPDKEVVFFPFVWKVG